MKMFADLKDYSLYANGYETTPIDTLVIVAAHFLCENDTELNYENITAVAYTMFPKTFCLRGYPQWPDGGRVNKSWLRCRSDKKWLEGTDRSRFKLTATGKQAALDFLSNHQKGTARKRETIIDQHADEAIKALRKSRAFYAWANEKTIGFHVSEFLLALRCTLASEVKVKRDRLEQLKTYAKMITDKEAMEFLQQCESFFAKDFRENDGTRGGMNRRRS